MLSIEGSRARCSVRSLKGRAALFHPGVCKVGRKLIPATNLPYPRGGIGRNIFSAALVVH